MSIYDWSATLKTHRRCVGDTSRTNSYATALSEVVKPGDIVVDVGTGTGILAIMACRAGAERVYAIEPDQIIESARRVCAANGLAEQIIFLPGLSYEVALPEKADVLIAGHLHNFGFEIGLMSSTIDAQTRFLKQGASIIPRAVDLCVAPVELPDTYAEVVEFWKGRPAGIDYSSVRELAVENCYMVDLQESSFLSGPASLVKVRLNQLDNTFVSGRATFIVKRNGVLHGIGGWCSAELSPNVTLSNSPVDPSVHWSQIYFPITDSVPVDSGDRVICSIGTNDGQIWRWQVEVRSESEASSALGSEKRFDHSTFRPGLISKEAIRKSSPLFIPQLSPRGQALLYGMNLCNGQRALAEIEELISDKYGDCFVSRKMLSKFVAEEFNQWAL
jgi:Ribosomal protein L11 methyltransferase (PrmA)/PRMT5 oligomerisation domain